uniref:Transcription factor n=1 Tax=Haemonchus placei TaxID=6290 RepID=A0A0N4X6L1_HAEPC
LVSTGKILSDASRERDTPSVLGAPNADCPPPPAPLHCEGSIRRLQHAFQSSASSSGGSSSSLEQLPFANENCGTIKSKSNTARMTPASMSQPQTPRKTLPMTISDCSTSNCEKPVHAVGPNGNVLSDIGYMLQNLTDELDAIGAPFLKRCRFESAECNDPYYRTDYRCLRAERFELSPKKVARITPFAAKRIEKIP